MNGIAKGIMVRVKSGPAEGAIGEALGIDNECAIRFDMEMWIVDFPRPVPCAPYSINHTDFTSGTLKANRVIFRASNLTPLTPPGGLIELTRPEPVKEAYGLMQMLKDAGLF